MPDAPTEPCPACGSLLDVTGAQIFAERTCPVCATPIHVRRKFGHYELMSTVGSGGQGVVYRAVDNNLNRLVALKLLRTEYSTDPEFVKQFEHEAQLTASINHPNVVRVYSFGADEGHVYLAMELVDNGTMDDLMEKLGRIPEARALQIGIEVAQGLRAGQEKGLIHRDVKPGNVLFAQDGTAKVVDYGLAMFFEQEAIESGEIWGTPYYLSPERLNRVQEDFRSDMYSLGAALFHAIAGRPPFEAEDASHVALKHLRAQAVSLQAFAPNVSNTTAYVVNRTLAKNPDERQQSYDEFIEQLQFAREEALDKARGGGKQQKSRVVLEDEESKKAMSWVTLATLGVFAIGLVVGGLLIVKGFKGEETPTVQPAGGGVLDVGSYGNGWREARETLLKGDYMAAAPAFRALADKHPANSSERAFAIVHQGLALMFAGRQEEAFNALNALASVGTQVSKFFDNEVTPRLQGTTKIPADVTRNYNLRSYQALSGLFFALKDYENGHIDDAGALLRQYAAISPDSSSAWVADYRKLTRPLQDQIDTIVIASNAFTTARNPKERDRAYAQLQEVVKQIPANSKLQDKLREIMGGADKQRAKDMEDRMKLNFAFRAKVKASGSDPDYSPEKAVDGDVRTRWTLRRDGEKWLSVDLGSTREISRWVIKSTGAGGENREYNPTDVTIERSDDGNVWQQVDTITSNRSDIIDRVVPKFSARYVRASTKTGAVKQGDNGFRISEFELGSADEQIKTDYDPNQGFAMRFSTSSDFQFSPMGDPGALGTARYDSSSGKYTIKGSGADIWGNADNFHFAWQLVEGDCEIVARVTSLQKHHDWTKVGVMIRNELSKESAFGMEACGSDSKLQFARRTDRGAVSDSALSNGLPLPRWVKVERRGAEIIGSHSGDGQKWTESARVTIKNPQSSMYVGLAVCSHVAGKISEGQFDNVKVTKK